MPTDPTWHRMRRRTEVTLTAWLRDAQLIWQLWSCSPSPEISPCCRAQGSLQESSSKDILAPFPSRLRARGQMHAVSQTTYTSRLYPACPFALWVNTCRRKLLAAPRSLPLLTATALMSEGIFGNPALSNTTEFSRIVEMQPTNGTRCQYICPHNWLLPASWWQSYCLFLVITFCSSSRARLPWIPSCMHL